MSHPDRSYLLIGPCKDEEKFMRRTLDSVVAQTLRPTKFIIVNDGSTDRTGEIADEYAAKHDFIEVVHRPRREQRKVGGGVVEAFNAGLATEDWKKYAYVCKIDLDLDLPHRYFERLVEIMESRPRLGCFSGKAYYHTASGEFVSEGCDDIAALGMSKFYRTECYDQIGGFVQQVMWDAIDGHTARLHGWETGSADEDDLRVDHLRPMGSSDKGILKGRARHGFGQYYMGSSFPYFFASVVNAARRRPYVVGAWSMLWGYLKAAATRQPRYRNAEFHKLLHRYQNRALIVGKNRAMQEVHDAYADRWKGGGRTTGHDAVAAE
ncbi:glycosyltransferase [Parvularcula maris]|uniref:Glycosyltransferase n=1 Tax=Parvularcula maris TaxID=2965077 RepID=A0A9X2L7I0_9PROT|nr:glycosyltransferase [Parvularcula maris]MCQ8184374.1 glycosyltransferase [Parvularcula maris]